MTAPYSIAWDTRGELNGSHTLTAVARDASGNTRTSARGRRHGRATPASRPAGLRVAYALRRDARGRSPPTRPATTRRRRPSARRGRRGRFGGAVSFDGVSDRIDLPALGTFYKTGFTLRGLGAQADGQEGRRGARLVDEPVGRADDLGRPRRGPLPPHARRKRLGNYLDSGPDARRSASGSTSRRPTTARPRASTSTASRWRARRSPATSATRTPGGSAPTAARPTGFFDGLIDNVRIYDRALSAAEIQTDMASRDPARDDPADRDRDDAGPRRRERASTSAATPTATFNEPMKASTITSTTFQLKDAVERARPRDRVLRLGDADARR